MKTGMSIGEAAELSGVPPKTIRYYESIGLIAQAHRGENNYRSYAVRDVETLRFINRARSLGFSVRDVATLLALYRDPKRQAVEVQRIAREHLKAIDRKLAELHSLKVALNRLVKTCHGDERPDCPILEDLARALR